MSNDFQQKMQNTVNKFVARLRQEDPMCMIDINTVDGLMIQNSLGSYLFDMTISSGGIKYEYCVTLDPFSGEITTTPILRTNNG